MSQSSDEYTKTVINLLNMKPEKKPVKLYRVHWHEIATGRGFMSGPIPLDEVQTMLDSIALDDTVISDGYKPASRADYE